MFLGTFRSKQWRNWKIRSRAICPSLWQTMLADFYVSKGRHLVDSMLPVAATHQTFWKNYLVSLVDILRSQWLLSSLFWTSAIVGFLCHFSAFHVPSCFVYDYNNVSWLTLIVESMSLVRYSGEKFHLAHFLNTKVLLIFLNFVMNRTTRDRKLWKTDWVRASLHPQFNR